MPARTRAEQAGLIVTGTLGILLRAKRSGHLPSVGQEIAALRRVTRFFLSEALERRVLEAAGETPRGS